MTRDHIWLVVGTLSLVGMFILCGMGRMSSEAVAGVATLAVKGAIDSLRSKGTDAPPAA